MWSLHIILLAFLLSAFQCNAKRSNLHHGKGLLPKVRADTVGKDYRKQGLEVPYDDQESLGGEPVGNLDAGGAGGMDGMGGLGGDMHGYPTGMGAGAEPLGAYGQGEPHNNYQDGGMQQGLEEGPGGDYGALRFQKDGPPTGFSDQGNDAQPGDFFEGRSLSDNNGPRGFRPMDSGPPGDDDDGAQSVLGPQQVSGFLNPQPAMDESMSNNLEAMDKANVQGDSDVANIVRGRQNSMAQDPPNDQSMDQSTSNGNDDASYNEQNRGPYNDESPSEEFKNIKNEPMTNMENMMRQQHLMANKRILKKTKRKSEKFKGFKTLQHHHRHG